jgi:uncharacterized protein (UPF0333 family)
MSLIITNAANKVANVTNYYKCSKNKVTNASRVELYNVSEVMYVVTEHEHLVSNYKNVAATAVVIQQKLVVWWWATLSC